MNRNAKNLIKIVTSTYRYIWIKIKKRLFKIILRENEIKSIKSFNFEGWRVMASKMLSSTH